MLLAFCWLSESNHDVFSPNSVVETLGNDDDDDDVAAQALDQDGTSLVDLVDSNTWAWLKSVAQDDTNAVDNHTMNRTVNAITQAFQLKYSPPED